MSASKDQRNPVVAVVADDLTGAGDTAVQFAKCGVRTVIVIPPDYGGSGNPGDGISDFARGAGVLVVNTNSRADPPDEAYRKATEAARMLKRAGCYFLYKKIDSTLRGNLGTEIDAVLLQFEARGALVAPAFPRTGRTTRDGVQYLHGIPIGETAISRDPTNPVRESNLPLILARQSRFPVEHIPLERVRRGPQALAALVEGVFANGCRPIVLDAVTDEDLQGIAALVLEESLAAGVLWVGSAGLAEHLATFLVSAGILEAAFPSRAGGRSPGGTSRGFPALVIAGSVSEVLRRQVAVLRREGAAVISVNAAAILTGDDQATAETLRVREEARVALALGRDAVVLTASAPQDVDRALAAGAVAGLDGRAVVERLTRALGQTGAELARTRLAGGMVLTGGDTAAGVCRYLGTMGILVQAEVAPGIPFGRLQGGDLPDLPVITKAGAFGEENALVQSVQFLKAL